MFTHNIPSVTLNVRQDAHLRRLERVLEDQGLMAVLESLPSPDTLTFERTRRSGYDAISIFLGDRPCSYGGKGQAWACILLENKDIKPPVVFYDQEASKEEGRTRAFRYPRSASSLLRKAAGLRPPFCFLQHDPHNDMKDMRNMLCAIILYQAVKAGVNSCALRWTQFEHGLSQALRYIESHSAYREWRHGQKIMSLKPPRANSAREQVEQKRSEEERKEGREIDKARPGGTWVEENRTVSKTDEDKFTGGIVRSTGSDMIVQSGTGLSKLRKLMGKKFQLIDYIPATPIRISRHTFSTTLFAFRLQLGVYDGDLNSSLPVYVYPAHDGKNVMRILDQNGRELTKPLTFENLEGVNLLQPFATLWANEVGAKSKARAAKLRYMVSYYLLLAENQGLIGIPPVTISEVFGQKMCAACNELKQAKARDSDKEKEVDGNSDGDLNDDAYIDASSNTSPRPTGKPYEGFDQLALETGDHEEPSHITVLKLRPGVLIEITGNETPRHRSGLLDCGSEPDQIKAGYDELPLQAASDYELHTLQFEALPSSQRFLEPSEPLLASFLDGVGDHKAPVITTEMEAPSREVDSDQVHNFDVAITPIGKHPKDQSAADTTMENMHVVIRGKSFPTESTLFADTRIDNDKEANRSPLIDDSNQELAAKALRNESDYEFIPMDISSSLSPITNRSHTPAILVYETRASSVSNGSVVSDFDTRSHVERMSDNTYASAEQTVEDYMETQAVPAVVDHPDLILAFPKIIALSEDDQVHNATVPKSNNKVQQMPKTSGRICKDWQAGRNIRFIGEQSSKSQNEGEQTPRVDIPINAETDLTQLPSKPRGKKRKSTLKFDSDDGAIEEVHDGGWSKAFRNR